MAAIFICCYANGNYFLIYFFENQNFVTNMCFKHKKSDVMVILSKIEISVADCLKFYFGKTFVMKLCWAKFSYLQQLKKPNGIKRYSHPEAIASAAVLDASYVSSAFWARETVAIATSIRIATTFMMDLWWRKMWASSMEGYIQVFNGGIHTMFLEDNSS